MVEPGETQSNLTLNKIQQSLSKATDTAPTEQALVQQLDTLDKIWGEYMDAYHKLQGLVNQANLAVAEQGFDQADLANQKQWELFPTHMAKVRAPALTVLQQKKNKPRSGQTGWVRTSLHRVGGRAGGNVKERHTQGLHRHIGKLLLTQILQWH